VIIKTAIVCGIAAAVAAWATSAWITTASWFTADLFQRVFAAFLLLVAVRMIFLQSTGLEMASQPENNDDTARPAALIAGGGLAGLVASMVGVGGGIVLVPLYERFMRINIRSAVGTSSATIVLVTLFATLSLAAHGPDVAVTTTAIGYVDLKYAAIMALPAALTTRFGVSLAHRIDRSRLRQAFGILALLVSVRLFLGF
jgi:uncharacterized membrane protein YfcA